LPRRPPTCHCEEGFLARRGNLNHPPPLSIPIHQLPTCLLFPLNSCNPAITSSVRVHASACSPAFCTPKSRPLPASLFDVPVACFATLLPLLKSAKSTQSAVTFSSRLRCLRSSAVTFFLPSETYWLHPFWARSCRPIMQNALSK